MALDRSSLVADKHEIETLQRYTLRRPILLASLRLKKLRKEERFIIVYILRMLR